MRASQLSDEQQDAKKGGKSRASECRARACSLLCRAKPRLSKAAGIDWNMNGIMNSELIEHTCNVYFVTARAPPACVSGFLWPSRLLGAAGRGCHCNERIASGYLSPAPQALPQAVGFSSLGSPAPQALPQAVGFSSLGSPAPQALPQAVGFSSLGSPAPQALPQADGTFWLLKNKFLSIILVVI